MKGYKTIQLCIPEKQHKKLTKLKGSDTWDLFLWSAIDSYAAELEAKELKRLKDETDKH